MHYEICPSADDVYITLVVKGEITRKVAMQQNLQAHALGKRLGIDRYLVDMTEARNTDTTLDQYQFAYKDMQETPGIDTNARVAVVIAEGDHSHDFIETVAINAGLNVKLFTERDQAIAFLHA
ncbi:MAG: hypothetical protein PVG22_08605 [Chromatiales bacterium]|jgi:hypothetical protein